MGVGLMATAMFSGAAANFEYGAAQPLNLKNGGAANFKELSLKSGSADNLQERRSR